MATGDQAACGQMLEQLGALETAVVKQATGRYAAECLPAAITQQMIEECAKRAVENL